MRSRIILYIWMVSCTLGCSRGETTESTSEVNNSFEPTITMASKLDQLSSKISGGQFGQIHHISVANLNEVIYERNFNNYNSTNLHYCFSISKSMTGLAVEMALKEYNISENEKIVTFLQDYVNSITDQRILDISIKNALDMRAGIEWDELSVPYNHSDNDWYKMSQTNDQIEYVISKAVSHDSGQVFTYNGGLSIILSHIVQVLSGMTMENYLYDRLFKKLDISNWDWSTVPPGVTDGDGGLKLSAKDMIKIGMLGLNEGRWNNEQLLDANWFKKISESALPSSINEYTYANQWWLYSSNTPEVQTIQGEEIYFAWGFGGQNLWIIPSLDLTVLVYSGNYSDPVNQAAPLSFFRTDILPALLLHN